MAQVGRSWFGGAPAAPAQQATSPDNGAPVTPGRPPVRSPQAEAQYQALKSDVHNKLIERVDLYRGVDPDVARVEVRGAIEALLTEVNVPIDPASRQQLIKEIEDDIFGLGPLEPLLDDPTVDDILVNNAQQVYIERSGRLEPTDVKFRNDGHLLNIIDRVVSRVGRRVDEASPMADARLRDGSRVHVVIPPLALDGAILSIRKFKKEPMHVEDLVKLGTIPTGLAAMLERVVKARLSILISGGTGAGKTTMLNVLSSFIPDTERIITIEDAAELRLQQRHVLRLEVRPPNIEGKGEVTQRELVRNALRMRPDRIIVGEVRSAEALDMLQAMNTGHEGSITTVHANTPRDALSRLETMILLAGSNLTQRAMRQQISSAIDLVIQVQRFSDGVRRMVSFSEIVGMEGDIITMQDLFVYKQAGVATDGKVIGEFQYTGVRPMFAERLESMGLGVDLGTPLT